MSLINIGLFAEGSTDLQFLQPVVSKAIEKMVYSCPGLILFQVFPIRIPKTELGFAEQVLEASKDGVQKFGMTILLVHTDADKPDSKSAYLSKIDKATRSLSEYEDDSICKNIVPIVPVYETEAWMLADKGFFKSEIGTKLSDAELKIHRNPESIARPKEVIEEAIRISRKQLTKKRREALTISDLYSALGQVEIEKLEKLESFRDFQSNLEHAFRKLNLLH